MEFTCRASSEGRLELGRYNREKFVGFLKEHPNALIRISTVLPESKKQRGFLEGAVIPLVTFYQDGLDHRSSADNEKVREWLKLEFWSEFVLVNGKSQKLPRSTKGSEALNAFVEKVIDWLHENYEPPVEALDPEGFKLWRDTVRSFGGPTDYISYLVETGVLKK